MQGDDFATPGIKGLEKMTPEERAAKWADQCARHDCQCGAGSAPTDDFPCLDAVADFRAAENDALERAAILTEQRTGFEDLLRLNGIADSIRALKHPMR